MARTRTSTCHSLLSSKEDGADCVAEKSFASDDPDRNRPLDFFLRVGNEQSLTNSTRSVSTQSDELEEDWVLVERPRSRRYVLAQADSRLNSSEKIGMYQKILRANSFKIQQTESRVQELQISLDSVKRRHELILRHDRMTMGAIIADLEEKLKEQKAENNRLETERGELHEKVEKLQAQCEYYKELTTPQPETTSNSAIPPTAVLSSKLDDGFAEFGGERLIPDHCTSESNTEEATPKLVYSQLKFLLQIIPAKSELVTLGLRKLFARHGVCEADSINEENLSVSVDELETIFYN